MTPDSQIVALLPAQCLLGLGRLLVLGVSSHKFVCGSHVDFVGRCYLPLPAQPLSAAYWTPFWIFPQVHVTKANYVYRLGG